MRNRAIALLLSTVMIASAFMVALVLPATWGNVDRETSISAAGDNTGDGLTAETAFLIGTRGTLDMRLRAATAVNREWHFRLINNIDLTGAPWVPVPTFVRTATFHGDGHTIMGLNIHEGANRGMFANFQGTMRDVTFTNVNIVGGGATNAGVIAGEITGSITGTEAERTVLFDNVHVRGGTFGNDVTPAASRTGGFVGHVNSTGASADVRHMITIQNSSVEIPLIRGLANGTGGFIGEIGGSTANQNMNLSITNSNFNGEVRGNSVVGGLVGRGASTIATRSIVLQNNTVTGNVTGINNVGTFGATIGGMMGSHDSRIALSVTGNTFNGEVRGSHSLGGIIGATSAASANIINVQNNTANATITGNSSQVGGIIGIHSGQTALNAVGNNFAGTIHSAGWQGGIIGLISGSSAIVHQVLNSRVEATITSTGGNLGGIVGSVWSANSININNAYFNGYISGGSSSGSVGGILGHASTGSTSHTITIQNSQAHGTVTNTINSTGIGVGGVVGQISGNNLTIRGSKFEGDVIGNTNTGGILGLIGGTSGTMAGVSVVIEYSYMLGTIHSLNTGAAIPIGGVIGGYRMTQLGGVTVRNTFVAAEITRAGAAISTGLGGIIGHDTLTAGAAARIERISTITIQNSFFSSTLANSAIMPSVGVAGTLLPLEAGTHFTNSGAMTSTDMGLVGFVAIMNTGLAPIDAMFVVGRYFPQLRHVVRGVTLVFDSNDGWFADNATIEVINGIEAQELEAGDVFDLPVKTGYRFVEWNTARDGSGTSLATALGHILGTSTIFYAQWERIQFLIEFDDGGFAAQTMQVFDIDGGLEILNASRLVEIYSDSFARTFPATDAGNYFVGWSVQSASDTTQWVDLGGGTPVSGLPAGQNRLYFYRNGTHLLDRAFIEQFEQVRDDGGTDVHFIRLRAVFETVQPVRIEFQTATSDQMAFGEVRVGGVNRLGETMLFASGAQNPVTMQIRPHAFHTFQGVQYSLDGGTTFGPTVPSSEFTEVYGTRFLEWTFDTDVNRVIRVNFSRDTFNMSVTANHEGAEAAISNTARVGVSVHGTFGDIILDDSETENYRLIGDFDNVRIWDPNAEEFVYFTMHDRTVSFQITEAFLTQFAGDGNIVVEALFVRQTAVAINVLNSARGTITRTVTPSGGNTMQVVDFAERFDAGTIIRVYVNANPGFRLMPITGLNAGELNFAGNVITITVGTVARNITINFDALAYTFTVLAQDTNGWQIGEAQGVTVNASNTGAIELNQQIETLNVEYEGAPYRFIGWFALRANGTLVDLEEAFVDPDDRTNLDGRIVFSALLSGGFGDGFTATIVARFAPRHVVDFQRIGYGSFTGAQVTYEGGQWIAVEGTTFTGFGERDFDEGTFVRVTPIADPLSTVGVVQGLVGNETMAGGSVIIRVSGFRAIAMNFVAEQLTLDENLILDNANGEVSVSTTSVTIGASIYITFTPDAGYQRSVFRINGTNVEDMPSTVVTVMDNVVRFTMQYDWISQYRRVDGSIRFDILIETNLHNGLLFGLLALAIVVPGIVFFITWTALSNASKKRKHAEMKKRGEIGAARMNQADMIKNLTKQEG